MLSDITYLDLETTGGSPITDRITEIALVRFENGVEVARWQTLVNPETSIPYYIQKITGIDNAMVANAPTFKEIALTVLEYLDGAVMAAHNVRFDHGFLKNEFKRLGFSFKPRLLCTVKLSRRLYPQFDRHGLDAIMQRHQLTTEARHRAMGDVELMIDFIRVATQELGTEQVKRVACELIKKPSLPKGLDQALIDAIPETCGVYLFYGENQLPLYIGKSVNLQERVMSHFSSDHASSKEMRISQEIKHIEWIETAGELGALLMESRLIKSLQPIHNRLLRRERQLCSWQIADDQEAQPQVQLVREDEIDPEKLNNLFGTFKSKKQAIDALRLIADEHQLCHKVLGLESGKGACFASQLKCCHGACCGNESKRFHHLRLLQSLSIHRLKSWPYEGPIGIKEVNAISGSTEIHVLDQWCNLGTVKNEEDLRDLNLTKKVTSFDYDTYKLVSKYLLQKSNQIILITDLKCRYGKTVYDGLPGLQQT